jgi:hypothetical protein
MDSSGNVVEHSTTIHTAGFEKIAKLGRVLISPSVSMQAQQRPLSARKRTLEAHTCVSAKGQIRTSFRVQPSYD